MRTRQTIGLIVLTYVLAGLAVLVAPIVWLGALRGIGLGLVAAVIRDR